MSPIADLSMRTMQAALTGLQQRIDVRAHNVANVSIPGFRAREVDFESALSDALRTGSDPAVVAPDIRHARNPSNGQGNTVDLADEMVGMVKDNLAYDTAVNVFNYKAGILGAALRSQ